MQTRSVFNKTIVDSDNNNNELKLGNLFQYENEIYIIANVSSRPDKCIYSLICLNDGISFDSIQSKDIKYIFGENKDLFKKIKKGDSINLTAD